MSETYPKTIHKLPTRLENDGANHDVLAWVLTKNRDGNYPGGYVLAHNPHMTDAYVVWNVVTADGGETWHVTGSGAYAFTHKEALIEFMYRLACRDIATERLTEPEPVPLWRRVGRMREAELLHVLDTADDSSDLWDAAHDELGEREAQRAANNGEMSGLPPEF